MPAGLLPAQSVSLSQDSYVLGDTVVADYDLTAAPGERLLHLWVWDQLSTARVRIDPDRPVRGLTTAGARRRSPESRAIPGGSRVGRPGPAAL